jgi:hypothetical protein
MLYLGDCLEILPSIDINKKIHLVLIDLPYGRLQGHFDRDAKK